MLTCKLMTRLVIPDWTSLAILPLFSPLVQLQHQRQVEAQLGPDIDHPGLSSLGIIQHLTEDAESSLWHTGRIPYRVKLAGCTGCKVHYKFAELRDDASLCRMDVDAHRARDG